MAIFHSFLWLSNIPLYIQTTAPLHIHCRWTIRLFPCLGYCKWCYYEHRAACIFSNESFIWIICLGVGLLDHMATLFRVSWGSFILFFIEAIPIYVSTNSGGGFPFLHTLFSIICRLFDGGNSDCCEVIHQGIFDCISWVVSDAEHLLMCLLTTCTYIICIKGKWPFFYKSGKIFFSGLTFVF